MTYGKILKLLEEAMAKKWHIAKFKQAIADAEKWREDKSIKFIELSVL